MKTIITIGRQFGSGGKERGEKLAKHFGIKCYDKELLSMAAKESGICEEMIKVHDERPTNSFLYNLFHAKLFNFLSNKANNISSPSKTISSDSADTYSLNSPQWQTSQWYAKDLEDVAERYTLWEQEANARNCSCGWTENGQEITASQR